MKQLIRRVLCAALCAVMLSTLFTANAQAAGSYKDVPRNHWAAFYIQAATAEGLFQGRSDGRFGLGEKMSRAAFATVLVRMFGWEEVDPARGSFDDNQNPDAWYYTAVETIWTKIYRTGLRSCSRQRRRFLCSWCWGQRCG